MNGSDDVAVKCDDNDGSNVYLINEDRLLDDEEQAASDSLEEDLDKPDKPWPCLNRTGIVVVSAAVVGVFVVIGVIVVVILSVLSLHNSSKVGHRGTVDASAKVTGVPLSTPIPQSTVVIVNLALHENCTTRIVGSIKDGVCSFKVCIQLNVTILQYRPIAQFSRATNANLMP